MEKKCIQTVNVFGATLNDSCSEMYRDNPSFDWHGPPHSDCTSENGCGHHKALYADDDVAECDYSALLQSQTNRHESADVLLRRINGFLMDLAASGTMRMK